MKKVLLDTDIVSQYLKNNKQVIKHIRYYLFEYDRLSISIITKYEILSGLYHKDSHKKLAKFQELLELTEVLPLDDHAVEIASIKYAETRKTGQVVDDVDLLIASIALANNMAIATNNKKHFSKVPELEIADWMTEY